MTRNARKRQRRNAEQETRLRSNTTRKGLAGSRERPYVVMSTTASEYTTRIAGNTSQLWREER